MLIPPLLFLSMVIVIHALPILTLSMIGFAAMILVKAQDIQPVIEKATTLLLLNDVKKFRVLCRRFLVNMHGTGYQKSHP